MPPAANNAVGPPPALLALANAWLAAWQLSRAPGPYCRLAVAAVNHVTLHGGFVNRFLQRRSRSGPGRYRGPTGCSSSQRTASASKLKVR